MVTTDKEDLDVDAIVEKAFEYFDRFVGRGERLNSVLLEELKHFEQSLKRWDSLEV